MHLKPEIPQKKTLKQQYERVKELATEEYKYVFWIIDFDEILKQTNEAKSGAKTALARLIEYKEKLEKKKSVFVIINSPCLEFWIYLHFVNTTKQYRNCQEALRDLKKELPDYEKSEKYYCSSHNDIYQRLKDKLNFAIRNAELSGGFDKDSPYKGISEMNVFFEKIGIG